jgi:uncharacterized protein
MQQIFKLFFVLLISINTSAQQTTATKLEDATSDYDIQDSVLIKTRDGATISVMVVRKKGDTNPTCNTSIYHLC